MTIENSGNFYGFKKAGNLDNTPIGYPTSPTTEPMPKNTRTKSSFGSTCMVLLLAAVLIVAFCFAIFRRNSSSHSVFSMAKSKILANESEKVAESYAVFNSEDSSKITLTDNVKTAVESYMSENYRNYEYISKEQNGNINCFYYQIIEDTEFLSILTPLTLSYDSNSELPVSGFTINASDSVREWHLDGEWSYTDDICNYNLKINRSEGDTLYAEYSFSDKVSGCTDSSDGEISLTIYPDNDEHYHTEGIIEMDIYPDGATLEIGGDGAGIYLNGVWLNKGK